MAERKASVAIIGDASKLVRAFRTAASATERVTKQTDKHRSSLDRMSGAAIVAGTAVFGLASVGLVKAANAAKDAEASNARLSAQLTTLGMNNDQVKGKLDATIQSLSMMSGFDDEDLQDSFTTLVRTTGNVSKATSELGLVADVARGRQISLASAAQIVNRVNAGNVGGLKRLGIEVDKNTTKEQALAMLRQKFAGQAQAYGQTAAGAQERLGVVMENAYEAIGTALTPLIVSMTNWASNVLPKVVSWVMQNKNMVLAFAAGLGVLWTALAGARAINTFATAFGVLNQVMNANPILRIATILIVLGTAIYTAYQRSETFRNVVSKMFDILKTVGSYIAGVFVGAWNALSPVISPVIGILRTVWQTGKKVWDIISGMVSWLRSSPIFGPLIKSAQLVLNPLMAIKSTIEWIADHMPDIAGTGANNLGSSTPNAGTRGYWGQEMENAGRQANKAGKRLGQGMIESIKQARGNLASLAGSFGSMLGQAKSASYVDPRTGMKPSALRAAQDKVLRDRREAELKNARDTATDQNDIAKAQQDLDDFYAEEAISNAEAAAAAAGKTAEDTVTKLAAQFNKGEITADEFKTKLNDAIGGETGASIGEAFAFEFGNALISIGAQIEALKNAAGQLGMPSAEQVPSGQSDYQAWLEQNKGPRAKFAKRLAAMKKSGKKLTPAEVKALGGITTMDEWDRVHGAPAVALASGGIITSPTNALVGEAGREAVIPLDGARAKKMLSAAGVAGQPVVNLTFNGVMNAKDAARMLRPELDRLVRLAV